MTEIPVREPSGLVRARDAAADVSALFFGQVLKDVRVTEVAPLPNAWSERPGLAPYQRRAAVGATEFPPAARHRYPPEGGVPNGLTYTDPGRSPGAVSLPTRLSTLRHETS